MSTIESPDDAQFVESLTCWRTPLSDKQRIWLHDIVAKIDKREFSRAPKRCAWVLSSKNARNASRPKQNQGGKK